MSLSSPAAFARRSFLTFSASALAACAGGSGAPPSAAPGPTAGAGTPPDFELATLGGDHVRLADHLGKEVVLVDFWATFCEPCLLALPNLDALYRKQRARGFLVLGVSIDEASSAARVRAEASKLGLTFPVLLDQDTRVIALYNPRATAPYSVLIGRDGRILRRQEGYTASDHESLEQAVDRALG
ncbi:MAG TPA: TlpA disulfide reductase family protein [Polyangiaceae bacterium]|nr:TlpA disulfide reductase family protein [Polyangiaceae bacterium]